MKRKRLDKSVGLCGFPLHRSPVSVRHGDARPFAFGVIENCRLGPHESKFPLGAVTGTAHGDAFPKPNAFLVRPRCDEYDVAGIRMIDGFLNGFVLAWYQVGLSRGRESKKVHARQKG